MNISRLCQAALALALSLPLVGCSHPAPPVVSAPVEMKNGVPLTAEQIRERDAYIARAANKKRQREADALKQAQLRVIAAQLEANEFQRRQGLKLDRWEQAQREAMDRAAREQARRDAAYAVAPPQEPKFQVVPGWNGSAPTQQEQRPAVTESYDPSRVVQEDPNNYVPPVEYQNLTPGSGGTRVVQPDYGPSGSNYTYRRPRQSSSYRSGYGGFGGNYSGGYGYSGSSSRSRRGWDGAPKNVHVRSYTRSDGTYVRSHYRRSPR